MFRLRKTLKLLTTLPLLVAIVATGFVPVTRASSPCFEGNGVKLKSACATSRKCCCGMAGDSRTCSCCRDNESPPPPPATPIEPERTYKWMPWADASAAFVIVTCERAILSQGSGLYSPLKRSVQSLLCIWRI